VNVPLRHQVENLTLARALADDLFQPARWLESDAGRLLLGGGRSTPIDEIERLARFAHPLPPPLALDVARLLSRREPVVPPPVPTRLFVSVKDNLVHPEDALDAADPAWAPASAQRLGRVEFFARDYGHLDWLTTDAALDDVAPVLVDALEALP
jgi:hypothetical protein